MPEPSRMIPLYIARVVDLRVGEAVSVSPRLPQPNCASGFRVMPSSSTWVRNSGARSAGTSARRWMPGGRWATTGERHVGLHRRRLVMTATTVPRCAFDEVVGAGAPGEAGEFQRGQVPHVKSRAIVTP